MGSGGEGPGGDKIEDWAVVRSYVTSGPAEKFFGE